MPKLSRPDVEDIRNISTAIVIDQKRMGRNLRSTVGTATEINTYLRLLFSRCGDRFIGPSFLFGFNHPEGMCPECKGFGKKIEVDVDLLIRWDRSIRQGAVNHPDYKVEGWNWREMVAIKLFDPDKRLADFTREELNDLLYTKGIPVDKKHGAGTYTKNYEGIIRKLERLYISKGEDNLSSARKNAYLKYFVEKKCNQCNGTRLNERARSVRISGKNIAELMEMELSELNTFLNGVEGEIAGPIVKKIQQVLGHMIDIGVGYLSLNRPVSTLSGGESQRVKMARQLDCDLVEMMYIMDEPSIGLHARDIDKLIKMLVKLKEKGNSVFVVEHDPEIIKSGEWIVDIGPKAGVEGGQLIYTGKSDGLLKSDSITGKYLKRKEESIFRRKTSDKYIELNNISINNIRNISVKIPRSVLTCITGVAGSGKSSLINDYFTKIHTDAIVIDQSAVGTSVRSNPATYMGVFDKIRKEFASETDTDPGLFSFNSKGACPKCNGKGFIELEMNFLDDIKIICDECEGKRYINEVLQLEYHGRNIYDVLKMTIDEGSEFFPDEGIRRRLKVLSDVGLGYLEIGQPLSTLSGGEAQRIKLASELQKKGNIYVMDEPTTGLHMADIERLLNIIKRLVNHHNTVIVIEHNLEVISHADWIIDLGPEGGAKGGKVLFEGVPEDLIMCKGSHTGKYLKNYITFP